MGPYAGVNYNLTLRPLQSRLQHIYHGQPFARVDFIPQSGNLYLASGVIMKVLKWEKIQTESIVRTRPIFYKMTTITEMTIPNL